MKLIRNLVLVTLIATPLLAQDAAEAWGIDKNHSMATFKVRHFTANVIGQFRDFDGSVAIDRANPGKSSVEFTIQATSIDTGNAKRDEHLRSADFFDVANHPTLAFKSTAVTAKSKTEFDVTGDLTIHGVTKRVTLPVTFGGFLKHPRGEKAGFEVEATLNRKDYGIVWNQVLDAGGVMLGEDVKVTVNLELNKKMPPAPAEAATK